MRRRGSSRRLLGPLAGTAIIAGGAGMAADRLAHRRRQSHDDPTMRPEGEGAAVSELRELAALHAEGILTDEEFSSKKGQILGL